MSGADISEAVLPVAPDAPLPDAPLTQRQVDSVSSCRNVQPSSEFKCTHNPPLTITYWYTESFPEQPVILDLLRQFEGANPDIKINPVYKPFYTARDSFIASAKEGDAPDVLRADVS